MVLFNDPVPCPIRPLRAVRMAVAMRDAVRRARRALAEEGHELGFGVGIAQGSPRSADRLRGPLRLRRDRDVVNLAARLCEEAKAARS